MDFYVYDNIMTYNKLNPFNGNPNNRLEVSRIELPENGSFWFHTQMNHLDNNVNIQGRYVHLHPGIGTTNKVRFKKDPTVVKRGDMVYNPKTKMIEVDESWKPWSKPIFAKRGLYHGATIDKKMTILGEIFFNAGNNSMHFIVDYFDQKIKFHWEDEEEETNMVELRSKKDELEIRVEFAEEQLRKQNVDHVSDP